VNVVAFEKNGNGRSKTTESGTDNDDLKMLFSVRPYVVMVYTYVKPVVFIPLLLLDDARL
jgi:hypothetical protein